MIDRTFRLVPFPAPGTPEVNLTGTLSFDYPILTLRYSLLGNTEALLLPPPSPHPGRKNELWKKTCFEFFLASKGEPGYWEFNLSPSGDWNVYRMDGYRGMGFREETTITFLPFQFKPEAAGYSLDISVDLTPLIQAERTIQLAITAVIQTRDGKETYWALTHPAPYPDFHLRDGFILELAQQTLPSAQSAPDA